MLPVPPSMESQSPSLKTLPPRLNVLFSSSMTISWQPETQHSPMPRATTAAWEVMPPRTVRMPSAAFMPSMSSGLVSRRTSTTFSPRAFHAFASSAQKTMRPHAAPGLAARPRPMTLAFLSATVSNCGWRSVSRLRGSIMRTASSSVRMPSSTRSHAIFSAAFAVRLPLRVWSMKSFLFSIVNSMSCMSR